MPTKQPWWGYLHRNGTVHARRFLDKADLKEARESTFVTATVGPFDAEGPEDALDRTQAALGEASETRYFEVKGVIELPANLAPVPEDAWNAILTILESHGLRYGGWSKEISIDGADLWWKEEKHGSQ